MGLIVSQGENTMPVIALKLSGVTAENVSYYPPTEAYVKFLGEQNAVLAGTQRDLRRLEKRGIAFTAKPLHGYSDIVQYLSITAKSDEKYKYALKSLDEVALTRLLLYSCLRRISLLAERLTISCAPAREANVLGGSGAHKS